MAETIHLSLIKTYVEVMQRIIDDQFTKIPAKVELSIMPMKIKLY